MGRLRQRRWCRPGYRIRHAGPIDLPHPGARLDVQGGRLLHPHRSVGLGDRRVEPQDTFDRELTVVL